MASNDKADRVQNLRDRRDAETDPAKQADLDRQIAEAERSQQWQSPESGTTNQ